MTTFDPDALRPRMGRKLKYTVRLTRRELIIIESLLRGASNDMLRGIVDGFNASIDDGVRPIRGMERLDAERLADRLLYIEQEWSE
jgi:hypothetical protein